MATDRINLHFAPLQGYADHLYRRFHAAVYEPAHAYYTPFIRPEKGKARRQDMARLEASAGDGTVLVPQIIFNSVEEFSVLTSALKQAGHCRIDLNLGCPHPMQTRKGRGAAIVERPGVLADVCKLIGSDAEAEYSVKMRLGLEDPGKWRGIIGILNGVRLAHVAVHPRTAKQMYGGELHADQFDEIYAASANPVLWNGDVASIADIRRIADAYPRLAGIMIGRGLLARPSLTSEWAEGREWTRDERLSSLLQLHNMLFDAYSSTLCGETQILQKIKPFWDYLEPEIGRKARKALSKAVNLSKYASALASIS